MADKPSPKETVSFEELLMSNIYTQEALINLLEKKGILTKKEVLEEIIPFEATMSFGRIPW
jgi:hypothetical protein